MLLRLVIRDFVIVDRLELEFADGFGALTGETGAGKSILVDALSLALGERGDGSMIRNGAEKAEVSAEFDVTPGTPLADWLAANDFDTDTCILRRIVDAGGRSRAYLNGAAATLGQLREAADFLADIHGQHAHHSLLRADAQRVLLDAHAGVQALVRDVSAAHAVWRKANAARQAAEKDVAATTRERELLEWQVKELAALGFDAQEWQETEQEQRRLAHAASLLEASDAALAVLDEGQGDGAAALPALQHASVRLGELTAYDAALTEAAELFDGALIQLQESALALRRYRERLDLDPARLTELDARIDAVTQMARKHRTAPEELPEVLAALAARLAELTLTADPAALAEREQQAATAYRALAKRLTAERSRAAKALGKAVTAAMQELAMAGGHFEVALTPLDEGASYGLEAVEFLVTANPGQPLRPLAKVASGGELSRIGLALQVIASQSHAVGTLIFDEVDVGIGGRVAEIVGQMLKQLGVGRQVLCVTHLAQVAARADWQWSIAKETRNDNAGAATVSRVTPLDAEGRVEEVARMLGGVKITDTTRQHAREMLET
ncbi:MAG: DNA repair protein RecN [Gammaproteobacteria bacterium]|nr:DNA repair protein RecN [Rhodocyclaceae bacterium]MBU3908713.1 DNA repair protein RecN [Gammaproteobacteria bacterium]MBU3988835.1 DNA repair protein RecN [Gammaproteobacteria bacterium]MBU4004741.1 DNA repair protein RecN [Gammaproteobacteria bacterium]MBU4021344.1 DNA repair protein RecN [Gammaproteobacteria bacterium]